LKQFFCILDKARIELVEAMGCEVRVSERKVRACGFGMRMSEREKARVNVPEQKKIMGKKRLE
jgi:hypothetical protein